MSNLEDRKDTRVTVGPAALTVTTQEHGLTCPDGFFSFSDKAEKVLREAPLALRSNRIARSSSLQEANGTSTMGPRSVEMNEPRLDGRTLTSSKTSPPHPSS